MYNFFILFSVLVFTPHIILTFSSIIQWQRFVLKANTKSNKTLPCTVVIPFYNNSESISRVIKSLDSKDLHRLIQDIIIVCDKESEDLQLTIELDIKTRNKIHIIFNPKNIVSKSSALNFSLSFIKTPIVLFLDADTRIISEKINLMIRYISSNASDVVIGMILHEKTENIQQEISIWDKMISHAIFRFGRYVCRLNPNIPGQCFLIRKDVFQRGAYFPESGTDDLCFSYLLNTISASITVLPVVIAFEEPRKSTVSLIKQRTRWFVYLYKSLSFIRDCLAKVDIINRIGMLLHFFLYYAFPIYLFFLGVGGIFNLQSFYLFSVGLLVYAITAISSSLLLHRQFTVRSILTLSAFLFLWPIQIIVSLILAIAFIATNRNTDLNSETRKKLFQR